MNLPIPDSHKYQKLFVILIIVGSLLSGCKHKHPGQYNYGHITDSIPKFSDSGRLDSIVGFGFVCCSGSYSADKYNHIIDSMVNDDYDSTGAHHYYKFGYNDVPQFGITVLYKVYSDQYYYDYERATFRDGYMIYFYREDCEVLDAEVQITRDTSYFSIDYLNKRDSIGLGGKLKDTIYAVQGLTAPVKNDSTKLTRWKWETDVWDNKNVQDPVPHKMAFWQWFFFISGIIAWICPFVLMGLLAWTDRDIKRDKENWLKSEASKGAGEIYQELQKKID